MGVDAAVALGTETFAAACVFCFAVVGDGALVGAAVMKGVTADCGVPWGPLIASAMLAAILFTASGDTYTGVDVGADEWDGAGEDVAFFGATV